MGSEIEAKTHPVEPFTIEGMPHEPGNADCSECWAGFPILCPECVGLMHAEWGSENYDGDYWLYYKCDVCGSTDYE